MRCLYREKIHKCGELLEVDIFPVLNISAGAARKENRQQKHSSD